MTTTTSAPTTTTQICRVYIKAAPHRLTHEIEPGADSVTKLTVTHDLEHGPQLFVLVGGGLESKGAAGGWARVPSDLKTLIESGKALNG